MTSLLWAICAAVSYASAAFIGGRVSQTLNARTVFLIAQATGILIILPMLVVSHAPLGWSGLFWGLAAGVIATVGTVLNLQALSGNIVTVTAPVIGVATGLVTVAAGLVRGERFGNLALTAILAGLVSVVLLAPRRPDQVVSRTGDATLERRQLAKAFAGGACVGLTVVILSFAGSADWLVLLLAMRVTAVALLLPSSIGGLRPAVGSAVAWLACLAGALFLAGDISVVEAGRSGEVAVAGVIIAMNPALISIAGWALLREKVPRRRLVGIVVALCSVGLFAAAGRH